MRVISLCPSNTEIVCALGFGHRLVGVDRWSLKDPALARRLPDQGRGVADVGTDLQIDLEAIAALETRCGAGLLQRARHGAQHRALQAAAGAPCGGGRPHPGRRPAGHAASGGGPGRARRRAALRPAFDAALAETASQAQEARRRLKSGPRAGTLPRRAAWEWWPKPVIVAGRRSWIHEFFAMLGVENVFADIDEESRPVKDAEVLRRAPTLCASWCGSAESA